MGLLDLKTDLKSLKYGKDTPGGGSSGQPYIQTDINIGNQTVKAGDDGRIRGGAEGAKNASTTDLLRIKSFIDSKPKGKLFITNQIGLQLSNPRLETRKLKVGTTTSLFNIGANIFNKVNDVLPGPTRIYNLGINTLAQVPVNAYGIHFNRHGLLPAQDDSTKYLSVVTNNNENGNNRLQSLQNKFQLGVKYPNGEFNTSPILNRTQQLLRRLNPLARSIGGLIGGGVGRAITNISRLSTLFFNNNDLTIDNYLGGPGSTYGIGKTLIQRYDITERGEKIDRAFEKSNTVAKSSKINYATVLSQKGPSLLNEKYYLSDVISNKNFEIINKNVENQNVIDGLNTLSPTLKNYKAIYDAVKEIQNPKPKTIPFSTVPEEYYKETGFGPFKNKEFESIPDEKTGLNRNPSTPFRYYGKARPSDDGSRLEYNTENTFGRKDADIMTVVFRAIDPFTDIPPTEDLSRRHAFSAYMKGFKDDFNATWNEINYAGRAESFYVYNKFKRNVNFNLQIPCFNRTELFEKHRNLGQLASTTAGAYNSQGLLGGVLLQINLGNYLVGEFGILNSLSYSIPDDASWDVTPEGRLSMYLDASFNFTIIHKELPQYKENQGFFGYLPNLENKFLPSVSNISSFVYNDYVSGSIPSPVIQLPDPNPITTNLTDTRKSSAGNFGTRLSTPLPSTTIVAPRFTPFDNTRSNELNNFIGPRQ
jgi:hypothetical protein